MAECQTGWTFALTCTKFIRHCIEDRAVSPASYQHDLLKDRSNKVIRRRTPETVNNVGGGGFWAIVLAT